MTDSPIRFWHTMTTVDAQTLAEDDPVIVLPVAAVEQHGPHLPLSTDLEIGLGLLEEAFRNLPPDFPAWTLPTQAVGASLEHTGFAGTLSLSPEQLTDAIAAHGDALRRCGVSRLVVSNSHGGNLPAVEAAGQRLRREHGLLVVKAHYYLFPRPAEVRLPESEWRHGLHGGAIETAMMLHLRPDLVRSAQMTDTVSLGRDLEATLRRLRPEDPGASFAWQAEDLHPTGITGAVTLADAAMGKRLVESYGRALAELIQDAKAFPIERLARGG